MPDMDDKSIGNGKREQRDQGGPEEGDALVRTGEPGGQANGNYLKKAESTRQIVHEGR